MVFSSAVFLFLFLPFSLLGYYLLDKRFRNVFLLLISLLFYAWGEPKFVFVMIGSIFVNYVFALVIYALKEKKHAKPAKLVLIGNVLFNISLFFIFKYLNFTMENINRVASVLGIEHNIVHPFNIALPIGISFFTFQALSYVFDVYNGKGKLQRNPLNLALYIALFPQLIAGPIVRYQTVADEIVSRRESLGDFKNGIKRFIIGLAKKTIIANTIAVAVDAAYLTLQTDKLTVGYSWLGAIAYSLQIYFDFSGYSDMAIGLGLMFGFHFLENFEHPYMSKTVSEFWRRWHISLGSWFRDYVYIPLGGSRVSKWRLVCNLFVVWILTGIWHGANWTFIVWGAMYFLLLTIEKLTGIEKRIKNHALVSVIYRVFTLLCVICGWVMFRANSLNDGMKYMKAMFGGAPNGFWSGMTGSMWEQYIIILIIAIIFCIDWKTIVPIKYFTYTDEMPTWMYFFKVIVYAVLAVVSVSFTVASTYNPFIYFNF